MSERKLEYLYEHTAYRYNVDLNIEASPRQKVRLRILQSQRISDAVRLNLRGIAHGVEDEIVQLLEQIDQECEAHLLIQGPGNYTRPNSNGRGEEVVHHPTWSVSLYGLDRGDMKVVHIDATGDPQDEVAAVMQTLREAFPQLLTWLTTPQESAVSPVLPPESEASR